MTQLLSQPDHKPVQPLTKSTLRPENFAEQVVWWGIVGTYGFFIIGGVYVAGSLLGWLLFANLVHRLLLQTEQTPPKDRIQIPWTTWVWVTGMIMMEVALVVGHLDFGLGMGLILKSTIGWAKGWALLAVFPLAGCLKIRPQLLYRAACVLCLQTVLLFPLFLLAYLLHLPDVLYVSPLKAVGGPGPYFFDVPLYEIDPTTGGVRWRLFTPWAPALGFVGNIYFVLSVNERDWRWRWAGIVGSILMCLVPASRLALISLVAAYGIAWLLTNFARPALLLAIGVVSVMGGIFSPILLIAAEGFWDLFKGARAESTRVRKTLGEIALERWWTEAQIWGHGVVEEGPHLVEYMPIGSHHTWFGLLFVKGVVGFAALLLPMLFSFLDLVIKAPDSKQTQAGLAILIILFLYTFGENLEILVYLFWPGLLVMGLAFAERFPSPSRDLEAL